MLRRGARSCACFSPRFFLFETTKSDDQVVHASIGKCKDGHSQNRLDEGV
jgi:hypothetical protein